MKKRTQHSGANTDVCSFYCTGDDEKGEHGSQTDLLIVRKDDAINLCEMKFSKDPYIVTKEDGERMQICEHDLRTISKTKSASLTDTQERTSYISDGVYASQGECLDTGISGSIKNYVVPDGELHLTDRLPSGEKYVQLTCSLLYLEKTENVARHFIGC